MLGPSSKTRTLFMLSSFVFIHACEIGGEKRDIPQEDSVIVSYFFSDQYATDNDEYRDFLSFFFGAVVAASPNSSMNLWISPPNGCYYSSSYIGSASREVGIRRYLDIGTLRLKAGTDSPLDLNKTPRNDYYFPQALQTGAHTLISPGMRNGSLAFNHAFEVAEKGGGIQVYTLLPEDGEYVAIEQPLASPATPAETDANYRIVFNRMTDNAVSFEAPPGTDYVRLRLRDGSNTNAGDVVCFGRPGEAIFINRGVLFSFRTGTQGHMELDFVKSHALRDVSRLKQGQILSTMRHFQGTFEYNNADGIKVTDNVGLIEFR
jgi:hypothetical protein